MAEDLERIYDKLEQVHKTIGQLSTNIALSNQSLENHIKWSGEIHQQREEQLAKLQEDIDGKEGVKPRVTALEGFRDKLQLFKWPITVILAILLTDVGVAIKNAIKKLIVP